MTDGGPSEGVVIAVTTIRVPAPGHRRDAMVALVEAAGSRRLITLAIDSIQMPRPGDSVRLD
jgi:uncharacterized OB-fold protein